MQITASALIGLAAISYFLFLMNKMQYKYSFVLLTLFLVMELATLLTFSIGLPQAKYKDSDNGCSGPCESFIGTSRSGNYLSFSGELQWGPAPGWIFSVVAGGTGLAVAILFLLAGRSSGGGYLRLK